MKFQSIQKKIDWSPEDRARHRAIRERFQRERPTPEELIASGEYSEPVPLGVYFDMKVLFHNLKQEREKLGLSLADVAERSGIDKSALSRLENGHQRNPTLDTLMRYAAALGKQILWVFQDVPPKATS